MRRILLISANRYKEPYPVYPLGLSYLKGYILRELPHLEVEIVDCNILSDEEIGRRIEVFRPDIIGLSLRNIDGANSLDVRDFLEHYQELVTLIRKSSTAYLVIGGAGFSIFPEVISERLMPDFSIVGEGEKAFIDLINHLEKREESASVKMDKSMGSCKIINQGSLGYLSTLDVAFEEDLVGWYWQSSGMLNLQTKRGCPYNCIYCTYPLIEGRQVRTLDPEKTVEDLLRLKRNHGINYVFFTDSVFNIGKSYNLKLASLLIESNAKINWGAYFRPSGLDNETMRLFKESGLTHIEFGTESFCDTQLVNYGKGFSFEDVVKSSDICLDLGIYYAHFLILGGYGETKQTIAETMVNSKRLRHTVFFPYIGMRIYPNTRLQQIAVSEGIIEATDDLIAPKYYISNDFDVDMTKKLASETGKAWVFPDSPHNEMMDMLRIKRKKKGLLWEYLRRP